MHAELLLPIFY